MSNYHLIWEMLLDLHVKQVTIREAVYVAINTCIEILSDFDDYQYSIQKLFNSKLFCLLVHGYI